MTKEEKDFEWVKTWIDTKCPAVPEHSKWYKFICWMAFRPKKKFTYKEVYILLCNINKAKEEEKQKDVQRNAMEQIINIYKWNQEHENDK